MSGRILFCGDRKWDDAALIRWVIEACVSQYGDEIAVIHGAAAGADSMAGQASLDLDLVTVAVPAKWEKHGKAAGPIRNRYMLERCKPHLVIAFHPSLPNSKGTKNMVEISRQAGIPVLHMKNRNDMELIHNELPANLYSENPDARTASTS